MAGRKKEVRKGDEKRLRDKDVLTRTNHAAAGILSN